MQIRVSKLQDLEAITAIYNYEINNSVATFDKKEKTASNRRSWFYEHQKSPYLLLTAEEQGQVLGYASLSPYGAKDAFATTAELSIYVDKTQRGKGLGEKLIRAIIERAKNEGKIHLIISVITSSNTASIVLHKKIGFNFCGQILEIARKFGQFLGVDFYTLVL